MTLSAAELQGGFLGGPVAEPDAPVVVEAVLAVGGGGPQLAGRDIAYAGTLRSADAAVLGRDLDAVAVRAADSEVGSPASCAGSIAIVLPRVPGKVSAGVIAELGGLNVEPAGSGCTALPATGGTAVECPLVSIGRGESRTLGSLWVRFTLRGTPQPLDTLPGWAKDAYALAAPDAAPNQAGQTVTGAVATMGGSFVPVQPETATVELRSDLGEFAYVATLPFGDDGSTLMVAVAHPADGTGVGGVITIDLAEKLEDGGVRFVPYTGSCPVDFADGGRTGSLSCRIPAVDNAASILAVEATWRADTVIDLRGRLVRVTWRLGNSLQSEGAATVPWAVVPDRDPGLLLLPEVGIGGGVPPAILRLRIVGFHGDGQYSGDAVDPAIDMLGNSSLLVNPTPGDEAEPWTPLFGPCTAVVSQEGAGGTMTCSGDPSIPAGPYGGPTTLIATWAPAD